MNHNLVDYFSNLKIPKSQLKKDGLFIAEGRIIFERMLLNHITIRAVLCNETLKDEMQIISDGKWQVISMSSAKISGIVGYSFHLGLLTLGERPNPDLLIHNDQSVEGNTTLVICPAVTDEANLGSIIRSASALGASGVLIGKNCADPYSRRTIRTSMGNVFTIPVVEMGDNEESWIDNLKNAGYRLTGTALSEKAVPLRHYQRSAREALVFGHESQGLSDDWLKRCDALIMIPMHNGTDSLNVMVSAGIILYELCRSAESPAF